MKLAIAQINKWREIAISFLTVIGASALKLTTAYPGELLIAASIIVAAAYVFSSLSKDKKKNSIAASIIVFFFSFALFALGAILLRRQSLVRLAMTKDELVYNMTQDAYLITDDRAWITNDALANGEICYIAAPCADFSMHVNRLCEKDKYANIGSEFGEIPFMSNTTSVPGNKYSLIIARREVLKDVCDFPSDYLLLPQSTALCVLADRCADEGDLGSYKRYFSEAHEQGNAFATYALAKINLQGIDQAPEPVAGMQLMKEAARKGFRSAQYEWSHEVLYSCNHSKIELAEAEEFLLRAARNTKFLSLDGYVAHANSIIDLCDYYNVRNDNVRAYIFTHRLCRQKESLFPHKLEHIKNCLKLHLYKEALRAIQECESLPRESIIKDYLEPVYLIHAELYRQGRGLPRSLQKAEYLLRYAADSLNYTPALKSLSDLYEIEGYHDASAFFSGLFDAEYSNTINE